MSFSDLPPWDNTLFYFDVPGSIPQCTSVNVLYEGIESANPPPSPPYDLVLYSGGYEPLRIPLNNKNITGVSPWTPNLPLQLLFAVSMKDSGNYSGGVLERVVKMSPDSSGECDPTNPLNVSSLSFNVDGGGQCQKLTVAVEDGTAPYKVEVVPIARALKTIHFATSPFTITLDMNAGWPYWLAVYDSQGRSGVQGRYKVTPTNESSCLRAVSTVTVSSSHALYPGGTAAPTATRGSGLYSGRPLPAHTAISMGILIPVLAISLAVVLLWMSFRKSSRYYSFEYRGQSRTEHPEGYSDYMPVLEEYAMTAAPGSTLDQNSFDTLGTRPSSLIHPRSLINPDSHYLEPVEVEPFDPGTLQPNATKCHMSKV